MYVRMHQGRTRGRGTPEHGLAGVTRDPPHNEPPVISSALCPSTGGATSVGTVNVQGAGSAATLTSPAGPVFPGTELSLGGGGWTSGGTPVASLCDSLGGSCDPAKIT